MASNTFDINLVVFLEIITQNNHTKSGPS